MIHFLLKHRVEAIFLSIWLIILNIYKICFHVIGIDTEQALLDFNASLNWTIGSGRFASAFFRKILMPIGFNYDLAIVFMIVGWVMVGLGYLYCFEKFGQHHRILNLVFSLLFVACPVWAEQNYFVCSAFVNVYGIFFTVMAAFLLTSGVMDGGGFKKIILAVTLSVLAIGIYQALLYFLLANCVLFLTLKVCSQKENGKRYIISAIKCMGLCVFSVILYIIFAKVCSYLCYHPQMDYAGHTDAGSYLSDNVRWFKESVVQCVYYILKYVIKSCSKDNLYGMPECLVIFILMQIIFIYRLITKEEKKDSMILFIGNTFLFLCIFAGAVVMGNAVPIREQFVLPLFVAFDFTFFLRELSKNLSRYKASFVKVIYVVIYVSCFYALIIWGGKQLFINRTDYIRYQADVAYANHLVQEIKDKVGNYAHKKIVFIGYNQWELPNRYQKADVIGESIFAWDVNGNAGVNYRSYGMLMACGYSYIKPSTEEVREIRSICDVQDMFGSDRVILYKDDYIVVNLSNF